MSIQNHQTIYNIYTVKPKINAFIEKLWKSNFAIKWKFVQWYQVVMLSRVQP